MLLLHGIANTIVVVFCCIAVLLMPLGDSMALVYTSPIFVALLSFLFLKQPISLYKIVITIICVIGIIFIVQPTSIFGENPDREKNETS